MKITVQHCTAYHCTAFYSSLRSVLYRTLPYSNVLQITVQYWKPHNNILQYCSALHWTQNCKLLWFTATIHYCNSLHLSVLYCTAMFSTVLYFTVLHFRVLYYCTTLQSTLPPKLAVIKQEPGLGALAHPVHDTNTKLGTCSGWEQSRKKLLKKIVEVLHNGIRSKTTIIVSTAFTRPGVAGAVLQTSL